MIGMSTRLTILGFSLLSTFMAPASGQGDRILPVRTEPSSAGEVPSVKIGTQTWMKFNVASKTFRNGDVIPLITGTTAWAAQGSSRLPASSLYDDDPNNLGRWGLLYNYYAISDPRGICPPGWQVPTDTDWKQLEASVGDNAATKLKSRTGWPAGKAGSDTVGFAGLPAGFQTQRGDFFLGERVAYFWSITSLSPSTTTAHMLFDYDPKIFRIEYDKTMGMSLRCIKSD